MEKLYVIKTNPNSFRQRSDDQTSLKSLNINIQVSRKTPLGIKPMVNHPVLLCVCPVGPWMDGYAHNTQLLMKGDCFYNAL